jgi:hypothetical protein
MSEKPEIQTCPRRIFIVALWKYEENLDLWVSNRWSTDREAVAKKHDAEDGHFLREHNERNAARGEPPITLEELRTNWHIRRATNDLWLWPGDPPRTCNFCGGIHPEDAIRLVTEGWEVQATDKDYKRYLHPPEYKKRQDAAFEQYRRTKSFDDVPEIWSPVPPVKLYVQHLSEEQVAQFNDALRPKPT